MAGRYNTRVLFIARAYPPTTGGMERFAQQLCSGLRACMPVRELVNRHGKAALPFFLPYAFARAVTLARGQSVDAIHLADASLAPLGAALKRTTGLPATVSVCGLDVTYPNPIYQAAVPRALAQLDGAFPISGATEREMRARTGGRPDAEVIPLGVNELPHVTASAIESFRELAGAEGQIVLTVGRLVRRKGVAWFVRGVLPSLPEHVTYVVIGDGPERGNIEQSAREAGVAGRVRLLGRTSEPVLAAAYRGADVFVMPNIPVSGDIEGFGLVALEAAVAGLPVVAADLEGIATTIRDGENGYLASAEDPGAFARRLSSVLSLTRDQRSTLGARFAETTRAHYGWAATAARYADAIDAIAMRQSAKAA